MMMYYINLVYYNNKFYYLFVKVLNIICNLKKI